jgi:hypothetical protein
LDWDEDIVLPEGGLQTIFRPTIHQHGDVKKKISFASAISDELEDLNVVNQPGSYRSGMLTLHLSLIYLNEYSPSCPSFFS